MTNADKIRAMDNMDLAGIFRLYASCPAVLGGTNRGSEECKRYHLCIECWLDWLNAEAEGAEE